MKIKWIPRSALDEKTQSERERRIEEALYEERELVRELYMRR